MIISCLSQTPPASRRKEKLGEFPYRRWVLRAVNEYQGRWICSCSRSATRENVIEMIGRRCSRRLTVASGSSRPLYLKVPRWLSSRRDGKGEGVSKGAKFDVVCIHMSASTVCVTYHVCKSTPTRHACGSDAPGTHDHQTPSTPPPTPPIHHNPYTGV